MNVHTPPTSFLYKMKGFFPTVLRHQHIQIQPNWLQLWGVIFQTCNTKCLHPTPPPQWEGGLMYIDWREMFTDRDDDVNTRKPTKSVCVCVLDLLLVSCPGCQGATDARWLSLPVLCPQNAGRCESWFDWSSMTNGAMGPIWPKAHQAKTRRPACVSKDTGRWTSFCLACFLLS